MTRGCLWATMVVHGLTVHSNQWTIDWWCVLAWGCSLWCSGISSSWSLLPTCKLVSLKMMETGIFWLIKVSCILLLVSLLAWVLERLNAMLSSNLIMSCWFVHPLSMSECFLWHSSSSFLFHYWSGGLVWVCKFIPNHEHAQLLLIFLTKC